MKSAYLLAALCFAVATSALNHDRLRRYKPYQQVLSSSADSLQKRLRAKVEEMDAKDHLDLEEKSSGLSASALESSKECSEICEKNVTLPDCGTLRMAPNYNRKCDCLTEYTCCPQKCEKHSQNCTTGTFPVDDVDCCDCPIVRCDKCQKIDLPDCSNEGCEHIEYEKTTLGCRVPVCRQHCPEPSNLDCPKCSVIETYINASFCGCAQQQCVQKTCVLPKHLDPADFPCHVIVNTTDDCGCTLFKPEQGPYCLAVNKKAREAKCTSEKLPDKCFENIVKEKMDECGCDSNECALKEEKVENEYDDGICPKGHHFVAGLTPCGRPRDSCIKCPAITVDEKSCPKSCNEIKESKNFHGCLIKTCQKNPCSDCKGSGQYGFDVREDECGCKVCLKLPEIVIQRRTSVDNNRFHQDWNHYYRYGIRNGYGDFWLPLIRIRDFTRAWSTGYTQLVLSGRRKNDGKWMQIVYDNFYLNTDSYYQISIGNVVEKHETSISDDYSRYFHGCQFSAYNYGPKSTYASSYKGGWWYSTSRYSSSHRICLNCDQRVTHLWQDHQNGTIKLSETQMSIRIKV